MSNAYRPNGKFSLFPQVIKNLLIINGIVFFLQIIAGSFLIGNVLASDVFEKWFALNPLVEGANFQVWQLITYQFMHGSLSHIFFNMFMLWMFGMEIENLWGSKKFLIYYLLCGVVAGLFQLFLPPLFGQTVGFTIGASGAVFGVLIAFGMIFPDRYIYLYFLFPIKAKYLIGFFFLLEILFLNDGTNVARIAHLGGAITGFVYIMFDKDTYTPLKKLFNQSGYSSGKGPGFQNPFSGISDRFKNRESKVEEAKYYDLKNADKDEITQQQIDEILDKISQSGYQNLTEKEKKVLFEASKKMN